MNEQKLKQLEREEKGKQQKFPETEAEFDSSQLNTDVFNTVIAFRMLEIMRNNGLIDESEYAKVEKKRPLQGERDRQKKDEKGGDSI